MTGLTDLISDKKEGRHTGADTRIPAGKMDRMYYMYFKGKGDLSFLET